MKVIQVFNAQIAERTFQREFLINQYDPQISQYVDNYCLEAEKVEKRIDNDRKRLEGEIARLYSSKVDEMKFELDRYLAAANKNLQGFSEKVEADLKKMQSEIEQILSDLNVFLNEFDKHVESSKENSDKYFAEFKEKFQIELKNYFIISLNLNIFYDFLY